MCSLVRPAASTNPLDAMAATAVSQQAVPAAPKEAPSSPLRKPLKADEDKERKRRLADSSEGEEDEEQVKIKAKAKEAANSEEEEDNRSEEEDDEDEDEREKGSSSPGGPTGTSAFVAYHNHRSNLSEASSSADGSSEGSGEKPLDLKTGSSSTSSSGHPLAHVRPPHHPLRQLGTAAGLLHHLDANENAASRKRNLPDPYFLPFRNLEMTRGGAASSSSPSPPLQPRLGVVHHPHLPESPEPSRKKPRSSGVQSFSIDDILSHRTAELKRQQAEQQQQQAAAAVVAAHAHAQMAAAQAAGIVRPWDIGAMMAPPPTSSSPSSAAGSPRPAGVPPSEAGAGSEEASSARRKSLGDSSPLDALFQMASKTFEGLKAKSGKRKAARWTLGHFFSSRIPPSMSPPLIDDIFSFLSPLYRPPLSYFTAICWLNQRLLYTFLRKGGGLRKKSAERGKKYHPKTR